MKGSALTSVIGFAAMIGVGIGILALFGYFDDQSGSETAASVSR